MEEHGEVIGSSLFRALVRNHAKLAYNSVAAWLTGTAPAPERISAVSGLDAQLLLQDQVAQRLKTRRHQQGALSLETIEPRAVFDGDVLMAIRVDQKNRAKELIEDFMIAANQATAAYLKSKRIPSFRRILRSPERWQRIVDVAARWGEPLPAEPDAQALEAFLVTRRKSDPLRFPDLSLAIVKLIGRGEYVLDASKDGAPEHFGLAVKDTPVPPLPTGVIRTSSPSGCSKQCLKARLRHTGPRNWSTSPATARKRKMMRNEGNGSSESPPRRCCCNLTSASSSTRL